METVHLQTFIDNGTEDTLEEAQSNSNTFPSETSKATEKVNPKRSDSHTE